MCNDYADDVEKFRGRTCKGGHTHVALEVSLVTHASEYPPGLCPEIADAILTARCFVDDSIRMDGVETTDRRADALERAYFNELLESAPWKVLLREACGGKNNRRAHINILEVRACLRAICSEKIDGFGNRQIYGLDSQVGLDSLIKGRSPFSSINEELICGLPDVVGHRHYPGYYFCALSP